MGDGGIDGYCPSFAEAAVVVAKEFAIPSRDGGAFDAPDVADVLAGFLDATVAFLFEAGAANTAAAVFFCAPALLFPGALSICALFVGAPVFVGAAVIVGAFFVETAVGAFFVAATIAVAASSSCWSEAALSIALHM